MKATIISSIIASVLLTFPATPSQAEIRSYPVDYVDGDVVLEGFVAYDDSIQGPRPGILIIHDWQFIAFSDTVHSFTVPQAGDDPSKGAAYSARADEYSWKYMQVFLDEVFEEE